MISLTREELAEKLGVLPIQVTRDTAFYTDGRLATTYMRSADNSGEILVASHVHLLLSENNDIDFGVSSTIDGETFTFGFKPNHQTGKLDIVTTTVSRGSQHDENFSYRKINHETGRVSGEEVFHLFDFDAETRKPSSIEAALITEHGHQTIFDHVCAITKNAVRTQNLKFVQSAISCEHAA